MCIDTLSLRGLTAELYLDRLESYRSIPYKNLQFTAQIASDQTYLHSIHENPMWTQNSQLQIHVILFVDVQYNHVIRSIPAFSHSELQFCS